MNAQKRLGIVGPCAAGKSTLINGLKKQGIPARHIAQEHSYVPGMWQQLSNPDILIYLDVSYEVSLQRRQQNWSKAEYEEELRRLRDAREHAHFYLHTDHLTQAEVLGQVLDFLKSREDF